MGWKGKGIPRGPRSATNVDVIIGFKRRRAQGDFLGQRARDESEIVSGERRTEIPPSRVLLLLLFFSFSIDLRRSANNILKDEVEFPFGLEIPREKSDPFQDCF